MPIIRAVVVDCHIEDVFDRVADPAWLPGERTDVSGEPPDRVVGHEGHGAEICELEEVWPSTRVTHRDHAALGLLRRRARGREVERRLRALKRELERA